MLLDLLVKGCSPGIELEVRRLTSLNSVFWASVTSRVLFLANLKESPSRKVWHKDWIWGQVDQRVATRRTKSVNIMSNIMINCSQAGFGEVINDKWYMHALWLANSWYIRYRLNLAYVANSWYEALVETLYGKHTTYGRNLAYIIIYDTIWHLAYIWHTAYLAPGKHRTLHILLAQDQTSSQWTLTCPRTRCQPGMLADYDWPARLNVMSINFVCWDMVSRVATSFPSWHLAERQISNFIFWGL